MIVTLPRNRQIEIPEGLVRFFSSRRGERLANSLVDGITQVVERRTKTEQAFDINGKEATHINFFAYLLTTNSLAFATTEPEEYNPIIIGRNEPLNGTIKPLNALDFQFIRGKRKYEVGILSDVLLGSRIEHFRTRYGQGVDSYAPHATQEELHLLKTFFGWKG